MARHAAQDEEIRQVLDNGQKIIGRTSATELLTGIKGGGALEKYIAVKALEPFINKDLVLESLVPFRLLEVEGLEKKAVKLVIEMIYDTLDPDVAKYLKNNKPAAGIHWHRQLTENLGVRALVSRCSEVIGMAKECRDMRELREKVAKHYGRSVVQFSVSLPMPNDEAAN